VSKSSRAGYGAARWEAHLSPYVEERVNLAHRGGSRHPGGQGGGRGGKFSFKTGDIQRYSIKDGQAGI